MSTSKPFQTHYRRRHIQHYRQTYGTKSSHGSSALPSSSPLWSWHGLFAISASFWTSTSRRVRNGSQNNPCERPLASTLERTRGSFSNRLSYIFLCTYSSHVAFWSLYHFLSGFITPLLFSHLILPQFGVSCSSFCNSPGFSVNHLAAIAAHLHLHHMISQVPWNNVQFVHLSIWSLFENVKSTTCKAGKNKESAIVCPTRTREWGLLI